MNYLQRMARGEIPSTFRLIGRNLTFITPDGDKIPVKEARIFANGVRDIAILHVTLPDGNTELVLKKLRELTDAERSSEETLIPVGDVFFVSLARPWLGQRTMALDIDSDHTGSARRMVSEIVRRFGDKMLRGRNYDMYAGSDYSQ